MSVQEDPAPPTQEPDGEAAEPVANVEEGQEAGEASKEGGKEAAKAPKEEGQDKKEETQEVKEESKEVKEEGQGKKEEKQEVKEESKEVKEEKQDDKHIPVEQNTPDKEAPKVPEKGKVSEDTEGKVDNKQKKTDKSEVKQLFNSKGSLLETQSFARERLNEMKEKKAAIAKLIGDLQTKVKAYKEKKNPTEEDTANLKNYHAQFLEKLGEYEDMTRNLEKLMGMADVPTSQLDMKMSGPPMSKPGKEKVADPEKPKRPSQEDIDPFKDIEARLPKLIVCGTDTGDNVPKIIVCEPLRKKDLEPSWNDKKVPEPKTGDCMEKLNECFLNQKRLAAENAENQKIRHEQQQQILDMQDMADSMKQRIMVLEMDNRKVKSENQELQQRLKTQIQCPVTPVVGGPKVCKRELYMKNRGHEAGAMCPTNMQDLEQELAKMGGDIVTIANDLDNIHREKINFCCSTSPKKPVCKLMLPQVGTQTDEDKEKDVVFVSDKDTKYKDLIEQYQRLHNDFKTKVSEVAVLRVDLEKTRKELDEITVLHHELELMHQKQMEENNTLTVEKNQIQNFKDQIVDLEQQSNIAKQMFKASQEEMEEMRSLIEDQATQLDEYRNKYMKTLQIAEELKKENEFKEKACADQIAVEIQLVKQEMQEQLEELIPIKDLLKMTQQKLRETEQMHSLALGTVADLSQQLEETRSQMESMKDQITAVEDFGQLQENLKDSLEAAEKRMTELENENSHLKEVVLQLETNQASQQNQLETKSHELLQMVSQLETVREESARQVARVKERSEMIRKCLQAQIAEMEREVAQCRAATAFANRERDEIRAKLQMEICLLSENFHDSQNRIVQLQQHVNYLSASHPTTLIDLLH